MLTAESRAALAAMPEGCREALTDMCGAGVPSVWERYGPETWNGSRVPLDPTAIVAEAARMVAPLGLVVEYGLDPDGDWFYQISERDGDPGDAFCGRPLTAALRLFHVAYELVHGPN